MTNSVTYMESRQIAIGNYEGIKCSLTFSNEIVTKGDANLVEISEHASILNPQDQNKAARTVIARVSKVLDERETKIRKWSEQFTALEFDSEEKLPKHRDF